MIVKTMLLKSLLVLFLIVYLLGNKYSICKTIEKTNSCFDTHNLVEISKLSECIFIAKVESIENNNNTKIGHLKLVELIKGSPIGSSISIIIPKKLKEKKMRIKEGSIIIVFFESAIPNMNGLLSTNFKSHEGILPYSKANLKKIRKILIDKHCSKAKNIR